MTSNLIPVPSRTPKELRTFVEDFLDGKIFTAHHVSADVLNKGMPTIFLALVLDDGGPYEPRTVGTFYEYLKEAFPSSVNGYPAFASHHTLNVEDWFFCDALIRKILAARAVLIDEAFSAPAQPDTSDAREI